MKLRSAKIFRLSITTIVIVFALWIFSESVTFERSTEAKRIWKEHESAVEEVLEVGRSNPQFEEAIYFLSSVSGIRARVDVSYVGVMPSAHTKDDLKLWEEWFRENRSRLYIDSRGKVSVAP